MLFKINEVTSLKQLQQLDGLDVDFAGIKFNKEGEPEVPIDAATLRAADLDIKLVGIFTNTDADVMLKAVEEYELSVVQLNGEESPYVSLQVADEVEVIKTFRLDVNTEKSIDYMIQDFDEVCDYYLFEPVMNQKPTKELLDKLVKSRIEKPFFLSDALLCDDLIALDTFNHPDFFSIDFSNQEKKNPGIQNLPAILLLKNRFKVQNN